MPIPDLKPVHANAVLTRAEIDANARLIAAVPGMLAALQEIATYWDHLHPDTRPDDALVDIAMAALAKAAQL